MTSRTAVVAGGGIGGLAVAGALVRAGWRVSVLERAPSLGAVGAGITLSPNAVRAVDWLGLGEALRIRAVAKGAAGLRTSGGRWIMRTRAEALAERQGLPAYALHRADLHRLLLDGASGADLRTGQRATGLRQNPNKATVLADGPDGRVELDADLVVGADGLRSVVRAALYPDHPGPAYAGYVTWRGVVDAKAAPDAGSAVTEIWGRGKRFGIVPLADGRVYWYAGASGPERTGAADELPMLARRFAAWHSPVPELLAATMPERLLRHDIYHLAEPLPAYAAGRVALVGDAAHAITPDLGQGGALALEDAAVLADALVHDDVPEALARYDAARRERTQRLVKISARFGRIAQWHNPLAAGLRDLAAWLIPAGTYLRSTDDTLGWRPPAERPNLEGVAR